MNSFVIDANILFSAFISGDNSYLNLTKQFQFFTPDISLKELEKYSSKILSKSQLSQKLLEEFASNLFSRVIVIPSFTIPFECVSSAFRLCAEIDEEDTLYVALSLQKQIPLLTRDKPLYHHLLQKGFQNVILWNEFLEVVLKKN